MGYQIYHAVDNEVIDGCRRKDRHAQRFLFERYSGRMLALCCRYVKDRMDAEDVMVVAFTKVLDRIGHDAQVNGVHHGAQPGISHG